MRRALFLLSLLAVLTPMLRATTIRALSIDELARASSAIVLGQAGQSWTAWDEEHHNLYTYTRVKVMQAMKGPAADVVVKQIGGSDGHILQKVFGVRHFLAGESTLLFLTSSKTGDGTMLVVGLMQGNFRVRQIANGDLVASNGVAGVGARSAQQHREYRGATIRLSDLQARIHEAVQNER